MNIHIELKPLTVLWIAVGLAAIALGASVINKNEPNKENRKKDNTNSQFGFTVAMPPVPSSIDFCGERVPLENDEVRERFERELIINVYYQGTNYIIMKNASRYFPVIEPILAQYGIPDDFKYLCVAESALRPTARSSSGALGLWQFLPSAATQYGLTVNSEIDERMHTEKATIAACKYLLDGYRKSGSWTNAAAGYNMGQTGFSTRQTNQKQQDYYNLWLYDETSRYVFRILALKQIMENPDLYGFRLNESDKYKPYSGGVVQVDSSITNLVSFAERLGTNYKTLRTLNPWMVDTRITNRTRKQLDIKLP